MSHTDSLSLGPAAREAASALALVSGADRWTYADLAARVALTTERLAAAGLVPGDRVAVRATNRSGLVVLFLALAGMQATLVPLHPRLTDAEAAALVADCSPRLSLDGQGVDLLTAGDDLLVGGPGRKTSPQGGLPPTITSHSPCPGLPALGRPSPGADGLGTTGDIGMGTGGDPALAMLYTSGTTGRAKGAILARSAFVAAAAMSHRNLPCGPGDRWVLCLPLCHIGGLSIVTRCVAGRATVILLPRFEAEATIEAIRSEGATLLSVVPTMLRALLEADHDNQMARLRAVLVGGAAAPAELLAECARRGVLALTTYGLTEACSQVCSQAPRDPFSRESGSGPPLPGAELRIVPLGNVEGAAGSGPAGDAGGWKATAEEPGRIQVRGPMMMSGYHGQPPRSGGWFDTGDIGYLDEQGRVHLQARRTDLIVSGGENVYPVEVEAALTGQPGVREALVFAVPDERWGQRVAAAIVPDGVIDLSVIRRAIEGRLAGHKRPRLVCLVEALPVGSTGKVLRREALALFGQRLVPWEVEPAGGRGGAG